MAINVKDKSQGNEKEVSIEPVVLTSVKIRYVDKTIEVPNFISVDVEKPIFTDKEYERPVITDKEYERPVVTDKPYEKPVVKEVECEKPVVIEKEYERPILVDKEYERPVIIETKYTIPTPVEVPYDVPVVSMEKVNQIAAEALSTLGEAKTMLKEVNELAGVVGAVTSELSIAFRDIKSKLAEVKNYKIVEEPYTVSVPDYVKQTIKITGKVVSIGDM